MRIVSIVGACLCAAALLAADDKAPESHPDHRLIQGRWKVVSSQEAGVAQKGAKDAHVVIDGKTLSIRPSQGDPISLEYRLDPTQEPKAIDTSHEIDRGSPISQPGIYSIEGDDLKLCIAGHGQPRPTKVDCKAGVLLTLTRAPHK